MLCMSRSSSPCSWRSAWCSHQLRGCPSSGSSGSRSWGRCSRSRCRPAADYDAYAFKEGEETTLGEFEKAALAFERQWFGSEARADKVCAAATRGWPSGCVQPCFAVHGPAGCWQEPREWKF